MNKLIIFILPLMLSSCFCKNNNFTEEELKWTQVYKDVNLLVFKSNKGNFDRLRINKIDTITNSKCNWLAFGYKQNPDSADLQSVPTKRKKQNYNRKKL